MFAARSRSSISPFFAASIFVACGDPQVRARGEDGPVAEMVPAAAREASMGEIPKVVPLVFDRETALALAALPLACIDRPHSLGGNRPAYLEERQSTRLADYERTRAFYGCYDWHSAVNSTWTLVRILKDRPEIPIAPLIREKLADHLSESALEGEVAFFKERRTFERPYGWAWLLTLHAELLSWDDPEANDWARRIAPLADLFVERLFPYLANLRYPVRVGTHNNTAFSLTMLVDYARALQHDSLGVAVVGKARELFLDDRDCPVAYEPSAADFLSPCLEEAKLMSRILDADAFRDWYGRFMPAVDSPAFTPLRTAVRRGASDEALEEADLMAAESHLIGLALIRAEAMVHIARTLGENDVRTGALRRLAAFHARSGYDAMFDADYLGSHWIGTFALRYLVASTGS